jgi:hypothetical protein
VWENDVPSIFMDFFVILSSLYDAKCFQYFPLLDANLPDLYAV